jgi:hypothetical protein
VLDRVNHASPPLRFEQKDPLVSVLLSLLVSFPYQETTGVVGQCGDVETHSKRLWPRGGYFRDERLSWLEAQSAGGTNSAVFSSRHGDRSDELFIQRRLMGTSARIHVAALSRVVLPLFGYRDTVIEPPL